MDSKTGPPKAKDVGWQNFNFLGPIRTKRMLVGKRRQRLKMAPAWTEDVGWQNLLGPTRTKLMRRRLKTGPTRTENVGWQNFSGPTNILGGAVRPKLFKLK